MATKKVIPPQRWYYLYMVRCNDGTLYTGITTDLDRRIMEHNTSPRAAAYTRARRPVTLAYHQRHRTRSTASRAEAQIKRLTRAQKESLIKQDVTL
jgi:putative endonuclease